MALYIPHRIFHLVRLLYVRPETFGPYYVFPSLCFNPEVWSIMFLRKACVSSTNLHALSTQKFINWAIAAWKPKNLHEKPYSGCLVLLLGFKPTLHTFSRACFYAPVYSVPTHLCSILQDWTFKHLQSFFIGNVIYLLQMGFHPMSVVDELTLK